MTFFTDFTYFYKFDLFLPILQFYSRKNCKNICWYGHKNTDFMAANFDKSIKIPKEQDTISSTREYYPRWKDQYNWPPH